MAGRCRRQAVCVAELQNHDPSALGRASRARPRTSISTPGTSWRPSTRLNANFGQTLRSDGRTGQSRTAIGTTFMTAGAGKSLRIGRFHARKASAETAPTRPNKLLGRPHFTWCVPARTPVTATQLLIFAPGSTGCYIVGNHSRVRRAFKLMAGERQGQFEDSMSEDSRGKHDDGKLLYCSFCGKSQHEVRKLIAGPSAFSSVTNAWSFATT